MLELQYYNPLVTARVSRVGGTAHCVHLADGLFAASVDPAGKARLLASRAKWSGVWLQTIPLASVGLHLDFRQCLHFNSSCSPSRISHRACPHLCVRCSHAGRQIPRPIVCQKRRQTHATCCNKRHYSPCFEWSRSTRSTRAS